MFTETNVDPIAAMGIGRELTNDDLSSFIVNKLRTNEAWAKKALLKLYEFQTKEEREAKHTISLNNLGFNATDAVILTSFAEHLITRKFLSRKQMAVIHRMIPKYWRQIVQIADKQKLELQIRTSLIS